MALTRVNIPSPNYSSRGGTAVTRIVLHTTQGAANGVDLGAFFANPGSGVSSHVGIDDTPGTVYAYVRPDYKAWTAADANPFSVQAELCAWAEWDSAEWHRHPAMLENCAAWVAEEADRFNIPLVALSPDEAQNPFILGVCQHVDLGAMGGGHWDCGPGFPMGEILAMAGGTPATAPPPGAGPPATTGAPAWPGIFLVNYTEDESAATWQTQMAARGWYISIDGRYGSQSEHVCLEFQREKGLAVDGVVGPETWDAAWTAPVT